MPRQTPLIRSTLLALVAALATGCAQSPVGQAPAGQTPAPGAVSPDSVSSQTTNRVDTPRLTPATYRHARVRWRDSLTGGTAFDPTDPQIAPRVQTISGNAQRHWDSLDTSPDRTFLWPDLASSTVSSQVTGSYDRLRAMSLAYATKGAPLHHDPELRRDIIGALDWLHERRYNAQTVPYDNWFDWEIGTPLALLNTVILLEPHLSPDQVRRYTDAVERFSPDPKLQSGRVLTSGANRVWKSTVVALRGFIVEDAARVALARDGLGDVFGYVTSGDGFYEDGSFIQHEKHPYTGGYGKSLLSELANVMFLLSDTPWAVSDARSGNVYRWVRGAFAPLLYRGALMDLSRNREVSRFYVEDHVAGHDLIRAVLRLSQIAPPGEAAYLRGLARQVIEADTFRDFFAFAPINLLLLGREAVTGGAALPELSGHWTFAGMDRAVHRREGWAFGVAMASARTFNYESINGEHLRGWYTSDGMTALYGADLGQYSGDYWATVNPYRLPGTTVDTRPREALSKPYLQDYLSSKRWAGGVNLGGYGVAGMELDAEGSALEARKSWFMFDDEVVALGAGITSRDGRAIETTVDNRKLAASAAVTTSGPSFGGPLPDTRWLHVEGAGGYVFPDGGDLRSVRETRSGAWRDINAGGPAQTIAREYATFWFDHGTNPDQARYAYVVLPTLSAAQTQAYDAQPDIEVLQNTERAQVVRERRLGLTAANFWVPGRVGQVRAATPAAVLLRERGQEIELAISDPTQLQGLLSVEVRRVGLSVVSADPSVRVLSLSPIRVEVDAAGSRGRTHRVTLAYDPDGVVPEPEEQPLAPVADAYVRGGVHGAANYGTATQLVVANSGGDFTRQSYLKFDLSRVPGAVTAARLFVYGATTDSKGTVKNVDVRGVEGDSWTEGGLTWNTRPAVGAVLATVSVDAARAWRSFDVTAYLQAQQAADPARVASLALTQDGAGLFVDLNSREAANAPYLLVTSDPTIPVRATTESEVAVQADAFVRAGVHGDTNSGAATELVVSSACCDFTRQSYLKFDLSALSGEVASAKLLIYGALTDARGGSKDVGAYSVEDDRWTESGLTWNTRPEAGPLQGAVSLDPAPRWREIDVTALVRRAAAGDRIASLLLAQEGAGLFVSLSSREGGNPPYLRVTTYR